MTITEQLRQDYEVCRELTERCGANFSVGFRLLPDEKRRAVHAAYAFCRLADDIADEAGRRVTDRWEALDQWSEELRGVYDGRPRHPVGRALAETLEHFTIPQRSFDELIEGCRHDLEGRRYASYEDLLGYVDLVAVPIGHISLSIFGMTDAEAVERGRQLSTALQLTNILRDVREDALRERVYLPLDELEEYDVSLEQLAEGRASDGFLGLMDRNLLRARHAFAKALPLVGMVEADARLATQLMGSVYAAVLGRIEADPARVLRERVELSEAEKRDLVERHRGAAPKIHRPARVTLRATREEDVDDG